MLLLLNFATQTSGQEHVQVTTLKGSGACSSRRIRSLRLFCKDSQAYMIVSLLGCKWVSEAGTGDGYIWLGTLLSEGKSLKVLSMFYFLNNLLKAGNNKFPILNASLFSQAGLPRKIGGGRGLGEGSGHHTVLNRSGCRTRLHVFLPVWLGMNEKPRVLVSKSLKWEGLSYLTQRIVVFT